jgi:biotin carboxylase
LVAFHATQRIAIGTNGGSSHKRSIHLRDARRWLEVLGSELRWNGALSADVIVTDAGPLFIDVNPRLVEPENAWRAGVDLVGAMLSVALGASPPRQPDGRAGIATHQLLLAILGAADHPDGRRRVLRELWAAGRHSGAYAGSAEELTPGRHDPTALIPIAMASVATLVRPKSWSWFSSGSVENYALTSRGWDQILAGSARSLR